MNPRRGGRSLDLARLRMRLPKQLAQMTDEQLEVCLREMEELAHLGIDALMEERRSARDERDKKPG